MYLLRKIYPYPSRDVITNHLRATGAHVATPYDEDGIENCKAEMLGEALAHTKRIGARLLIIEDGGYFSPLIHQQKSKDINLCAGIVEQTKRGINRLSQVTPCAPIINVAESLIKKKIEAPAVAEQAVDNIRKAIGNLEIFRGLKFLVLGSGAIGGALVKRLQDEQVRDAHPYDPDASKLLEGAEPRPTRISPHAELEEVINRYDVIVGATGGTSLTPRLIEFLKDKAWLVSVSSERDEFDVRRLEEECIDKHEISEWVVEYKLANKTVLLVAEGFPINFVLSEGIVKPAIDPVLTELFIGALSIAQATVTVSSEVGSMRLNGWVPLEDSNRGKVIPMPQAIEVFLIDLYKHLYKLYVE